MKINIKYNGKQVELEAINCSTLKKISGLMFRTRNTGNLVFDFDKETKVSIHSFFVFFPFLAVWVDDKNRVLEAQIVKPFTVAVLPKNKFRKLIELPFNNKNKSVIQFLVGKERFK